MNLDELAQEKNQLDLHVAYKIATKELPSKGSWRIIRRKNCFCYYLLLELKDQSIYCY